MKQLTNEEILLIKNDLVSSKSPKRRSAAKKIAKYKIVSLANELLNAYLEERKDIRTWETQSAMINALAKINCKAAIPYLKEIVDENKDMDTVTMKASLSYIRLNREALNDMTLILSLLEKGKRSVFMGAVYAMAYDDVIPTEQEIITVLDIFEKRALRNNLCKFKNCDKNVMMERLELAAPIFLQYTIDTAICQGSLDISRSCRDT